LASMPSFHGVFARLPIGKHMTDYISIILGHLDLNNFRIKYGIDPEIYLKWKKMENQNIKYYVINRIVLYYKLFNYRSQTMAA